LAKFFAQKKRQLGQNQAISLVTNPAQKHTKLAPLVNKNKHF
jgi:hypothetical protein